MQAGRIKKTVAGFVVATAAVAGISGTAFASLNTGGYQRSSEGLKQQYVDPCPGIWKMFEQDVNSAGVAQDAGNYKSRDDFLLLANNDLKAGQLAGCDWAAQARVPTYPTTTMAPVTASRAY